MTDDEDGLHNWLFGIIDPFSGDIVEWGLVSKTEGRSRGMGICPGRFQS
jgi:hypothetical protein